MEDEVYTVEDIFERDTPLTEDLLDNSDGLTLSPITMLRRYMAEKELQKQKEEAEEEAEEMETSYTNRDPGMYIDMGSNRDPGMFMDRGSNRDPGMFMNRGYMNGGGIGSMMQPKQNFLNGGRVGLFMGGSPLEGIALNIYNSMNAYGYDDQTIADALKTQGLLPTSRTTPPPTTPPPTTSPEGGDNGGGDGGGDRDISSLNDSSILDQLISSNDITDRNRGMEVNENLIDRGNPNNDLRVASEEMGLVGGITDRNRGQTISPQVQEVLDRSISIEDFSKPFSDQVGITGQKVSYPGNQTGMLKAPPSISMAKDPNVQDPFDGKYTPSFEKQNLTGLESLANKIKGYDFKNAISPTSITKGIIGGKIASALNIPAAIGSFALNQLPKSKPVGMVDGKAVYGVGSFDKLGTNAINQAALNKTGNFTNYQLGNMNDPGRVAGNPTNNVFAGMNAQSAFGDISKGAQSRVDQISKTISKMTPAQKKKSSLPARKATFEKQIKDQKDAAEKGKANAQAAKDNQSGYGGSCFIAGTKVTMADGTLKNIENVKVGDKVKGHKEENTVIKLDPTLLADRKLYSFNDSEHYFFTSEHPFMTQEGWKSIKPEKTKERDGVELYKQLKGELKVGDKLVTDNGPIKIIDIKSKEMNNPEMPLYNFNVSNDSSYIADDYVVHNKGCFIKGTLITMADGTKKPVEQVDLGDEVAVGGKVFAVGRFLNTELYDYKGIKVSGSHMVNEDGVWMRVRDTKHGKSLGDDQNTVYVFGSENRRILINDILFTDYFEIEDQEQLLKEKNKFFDNWKTFAINEDRKNVNTLNAS